jgi:hypothetical protein
MADSNGRGLKMEQVNKCAGDLASTPASEVPTGSGMAPGQIGPVGAPAAMGGLASMGHLAPRHVSDIAVEHESLVLRGNSYIRLIRGELQLSVRGPDAAAVLDAIENVQALVDAIGDVFVGLRGRADQMERVARAIGEWQRG